MQKTRVRLPNKTKYKLNETDKELIRKVLSSPEEYFFKKLKKQKTITSEDLNFFIPEKWKY